MDGDSQDFLRSMPKVELHVHIEGSIRPETVLQLARRNGVSLPSDTPEGLRDWYTFRDFSHFVQVYVAVSKCVRNPEDIELVVREFLQGQHEQNILHTEATYTASTLEKHSGIPWDEQLDALDRARSWGERELGVSLGLILDVVRGDPLDRAFQVLEWAVSGANRGVVAIGLAGMEWLGTSLYEPVFQAAKEAGLPLVAHAGETTGPETVWEALALGARRIGHGVRAVEDPGLVEHLRDSQTHLEVCPTSNVCLGVCPDLPSHPLPRMVSAGLNVSVNSDDPPMFGTSLTGEMQRCADSFGLGLPTLIQLQRNAIEAAIISEDTRSKLRDSLERACS